MLHIFVHVHSIISVLIFVTSFSLIVSVYLFSIPQIKPFALLYIFSSYILIQIPSMSSSSKEFEERK